MSESSLVFGDYIVHGSPDAVQELQVKLTRLELLETGKPLLDMQGNSQLSDEQRTQLQLQKAEAIQNRFMEFHEKHPEVYTYMVNLAKKRKQEGHEYYGIAGIYEQMRWHFRLQQDADSTFKLANDFRSRYARLIMQQEPDLAEFFRTRHLRRA